MTTDATTGPSAPTTDEPIPIESPQHLETVIEDNDVVLIDFFATWCGPCQMLEPVLRGLAGETNAAIAKVDVDQHQRLASQFGVQGVPTLVLFVDGELEERVVGAQPADQLRSMIETHTA